MSNEVLAAKRILLIEDDLYIAELYQKQLEIVGYEVIIARDAAEGWDLMINTSFNLLLLDLMLPGRSGMEILHDMKQLPTLADLPVIVVSNLENEEVIQEAMDLGALQFITKATITPNELAYVVKDIVPQEVAAQ